MMPVRGQHANVTSIAKSLALDIARRMFHDSMLGIQ